MPNLPFDLATVNWTLVGIYSGIALLSAFVGNVLSFGSRLVGAIFTAVFFAIFFVAWVYWLQAMALPGAPPLPPV